MDERSLQCVLHDGNGEHAFCEVPNSTGDISPPQCQLGICLTETRFG